MFSNKRHDTKIQWASSSAQKCKSKYIIQEVLAETASYTRRAMSKLVTATQKRKAVEIEDYQENASKTTPLLLPTAITPHTILWTRAPATT
jgi:hypothetical protein